MNIKTFASIIFAFVALFSLPSLTHASITPSLSPSRTTGVAPLSVFFDASGTTASTTTLPFHELDYSWNFGDDDTATWTYGTRPGVNKKNRAYGPVAAHVFEPTSFPDDCTGTPCKIFTVTLTVYDGTDTVTTTQTISVTDPDAVFAGTNTICIATASTPVAGAGGCPSGASVVQQSNFSTAINTYATTGKRVLFNRGDTFVGTAKAIFDDNGPWLVGAYGTGALPKIQNTAAVTILSIGTTVAGSYPSDGRIMDLEIDGENVPNRIGLWTDGNFEKLLLLRLNVHDVEDGIYFGNVFMVNTVGNTKLWDDLAIVENTVTHVMGGNGTHGIDGMGTRIAIMGNSVDDTLGSEHLMRFDYLYKSVIGHNTLLNGAASKESLAIRGAQNKGIFTITGDTHSSVTIDGIADTSGITAHASQGDSISGAGVPANTFVIAKTVNSITLSNAVTAAASGVTLTLMGRGYSQYVLPAPVPTQYVVVSDNDIEVRDAYGLDMTPANDNINVVIKDIIVERNFFHAPVVTTCGGGPCAQTAIGTHANGTTIRNNIVDFTNWKFFGLVGVTSASTGMAAASNVYVYNNTGYGSTDSLNGSMTVVNPQVGTTSVSVKNNLVYMPALSTPPGAVSRSVSCSPSPSDCSDRPDIVSSHNSTGSLSTNQIKLTNPFPTPTPTTLSDFVITTGSYAIASGTTVPVYRDFYNNLRGATMDMGAFKQDSIPEDTIPPTVTSVNSDKGDGTYGIGEVIDIDISFSEAVTSTGNITITLETGTTDRTCTFTVSNSDTGTCNYTVQSGDTTGDLSVSSIAGTINDQSANPMTDFVPGTALETNKAFIIDTTPPTLTESSAIATSTDTTPDYTFTTTESGSLTYGGDCSSVTTSASSGSNTITLSTLSVGTHTNCTIQVTDSISNASTPLTVTSFTITAPTITSTSSSSSSSNKSKKKKKKISSKITYKQGERIAPYITLTTPKTNTPTNKKFTIKASASDRSGIQAMFVSINGTKKKRINNVGSILYTSKKLKNASIAISAYDKLGNVKVAQITVTDGKVTGVRYY